MPNSLHGGFSLCGKTLPCDGKEQGSNPEHHPIIFFDKKEKTQVSYNGIISDFQSED